jgi:anthranilate phosphoribosyltransferase
MQQEFTFFIEKISKGDNLTSHEAEVAMNQILAGQVSGEETSAFLMGMRMKGESIDELTSFVKVMRDSSIPVEVDTTHAVDLCGTGGDKSGTFNISTAAMFVVAGAGVPVLKHGNKSVSSKSGSYDVLIELGGVPNLQKKQVELLFNETGMAFMFAPNFHPAMKHVMPARRALKIRTFFNMLGPMLNPAKVKYQLVGTFSRDAAFKMNQIFEQLDVERTLTVHSHDGLDEVSLSSRSDLFETNNGSDSNHYQFDPTSLGYDMVSMKSLLGGDANENAEIIRKIAENRSTKAQRDIVELNAAFAIYVSNRAPDFKQAKELASNSIDSGEMKRKIDLFASESQKIAAG